MQRIPALTPDSAPGAAKPILDGLAKEFGRVPKIFASMGHSPAALEAIIGFYDAMDKGELAGKPHEAIALRVSQIHGCHYCTAAHTAKAKRFGASADEAKDFRRGKSDDPKIQALLDFAEDTVEQRGGLSEAAVEKARAAGLSDGELVEAIAIVVLNTFTNYINALVKTELDFPPAPEI